MQLVFEKWVKSQAISLKASNLFDESFLCYKAGANKAALLYSYVAFLTILKERLADSTMPITVKTGQWEKLLRQLRNESEWEEAVFTCTQDSTNNYFPIQEHVRLQIKYWKDRRNDAAHIKDNEINENHVELFWSFISSNLSKIRVGGGQRAMMNKFLVFYDPMQTAPEEDITPLITEIPHSLEVSNLIEFIEELFSVDNLLFLEEPRFYNAFVRNSPGEYKKELIKYLKNHNEKLEGLLNDSPGVVQFLDLSKQEIRQLWRRPGTGLRLIQVAPSLLRNNLIPANEIEELLEKVAKVAKSGPYSEMDRSVLQEYGYYTYWSHEKVTKLHMFGYKSINDFTPAIIDFMEHNKIETELIKKIVLQIGGNGGHPYSLVNALNSMFTKLPQKKSEFYKGMPTVKEEVMTQFKKRMEAK